MAKALKNFFTPPKTKGKFTRPDGAGNFDNMDDHNIVKSIALLQGTVQHTPAADKDIANKKYVDDSLSATAVTSDGHLDDNFIVRGDGGANRKVQSSKIYTGDDGKVGIGTASPSTPLHVSSTSGHALSVTTTGNYGIAFNTSTAFLRWSDGSYFSNAGMYSGVSNQQYKTYDGSAVKTRLFINAASGKIGIGTVTPDYELEVDNGAGSGSGKIGFYSDATHYAYMNTYNNTTANFEFVTKNAAGGNFVFTGGSIEQDGGTYTTTLSLGSQITGSNHLILTAASSYIRFTAGNNAIFHKAHTGHIFQNGDASNEWMRIDSTGKVGIGVADPPNKLSISDGALYIADKTAPSTPSGGGCIFISSGALWYIGSSGTQTQLAVA